MEVANTDPKLIEKRLHSVARQSSGGADDVESDLVEGSGSSLGVMLEVGARLELAAGRSGGGLRAVRGVREHRLPDRVEAVIKDIRPQWLGWLRRRHARLKLQHEDIVQDAAADLARYVSRVTTRELADEEIRRIGFSIL